MTNWAEYDAALRQRGSLTVWFSEEAIAAWRAEPRTTRGGQPHYSALAIRTALTLRAVFRLALRQTEGLIGSILQLLGSGSGGAGSFDPQPPRRDPGGAKTNLTHREPVHLLVDSTGLRLCGPGEWLIEKHGTRRRRSWRKLHIGVDAETGQILAAELTTMMSMMARRSSPCSTRSRVHSPHSPAMEPTIRLASTTPSPSAILMLT